MDLYTQIYNILMGESNPKDKSNELTNLLNTINKIKSKINRSTAGYYGPQITNLENKKFLIMDEISSYNFYLKNKNSNNNFDLHEMYGYQINSVLDAIFDAALDPDNKNQAAAWKLVMDRVAPTSAFEQEITKGGGKSAIQINITGVGTEISSISSKGSVIDGDSGEILQD